MALDFPSAPDPGDTFSAVGKTWKWDGITWKLEGLNNDYTLSALHSQCDTHAPQP